MQAIPAVSVDCSDGHCKVGRIRASGLCLFDVYVDGLRTGLVEPGYIDFLPPGDVAAMEVYDSATETPMEFARMSVDAASGGQATACGVVALWTK